MYVNAKMMPVKTVSGIREGRMKESIRGSEFKYDIFAKKMLIIILCLHFCIKRKFFLFIFED
jgi:hypothetical protein